VVWKKVQKINKKFSGPKVPILVKDGRYSSCKEETAEIFASAFSDISSESSFPPTFLSRKLREEKVPLDFSTGNIHFDYNDDFSLREFSSSLTKCKNSAPGFDGVHYEMIKNCNSSALSFFLLIFNEIWHSSCIPAKWKEALIIPILKPNKDSSNPLNYRPISLTRCLCKLME
jgi:potassium voltage-gated channel Eag-related subfamily H protein 8